MSRFDYIAFDDQKRAELAAFKCDVEFLEGRIEASLKSPRAKALALTKLEECFMWIGKALRDDQVELNKEAN